MPPSTRWRAICLTEKKHFAWKATREEAIADKKAHKTQNPSHSVDYEVEASGSAVTMSHPGAILQTRFLSRKSLDHNDVAHLLGESSSTMLGLLKGKKSISPKLALKLGKAFGQKPEFWLNAQMKHDLKIARLKHGSSLKKIKKI